MNRYSGEVLANLLSETVMIKLQTEISDFLDSGRGLAAILVLLAHTNQFFMLPCYGVGGLLQLLPGYIASCAVILFFLISGFVIALSIQNSIFQNPQQWLFDFFLRRLARIYPPLIFSIILSFGICAIIYLGNLHGKYSFRLSQDLYIPRESILFEWKKSFSTLLMLPGFIKNWSSISMNGPLWSISYEFWMYVLAALTVYSFTRKNYITGTLCFTILLCQIGQNNHRFIYFSIIWLLGFTCCYLRNISLTRKIRACLLSLALASVGNILYLINTSTALFIPYSGGPAYFFQFSLVVLALSATYYFKIWNQSLFRAFKFAATYSYTLYLIHFPLLLLGFSLVHKLFLQLTLWQQFAIQTLLIILIVMISKVVAKYIENTKYFYQKTHSFLNKFTSSYSSTINSLSNTESLANNLRSKSNIT